MERKLKTVCESSRAKIPNFSETSFFTVIRSNNSFCKTLIFCSLNFHKPFLEQAGEAARGTVSEVQRLENQLGDTRKAIEKLECNNKELRETGSEVAKQTNDPSAQKGVF